MIVFKGGALARSGKRTGLGRSFVHLEAYLREGKRGQPKPDRVLWSSTRQLDTDDTRSAARIMQAHAGEHPRVERPVYHFGLSLDEGEHLTREQWEAAVDRVLIRMGLEDHQFLVIAHGDTKKEHIHVVVNRVGDDGRAWKPHRHMVKARAEVRLLEMDFGLKRTGGRDLPPPDLSSGAYQHARRTGEQPLADRLREEAGEVFARAGSWQELEEGLAALGYRLERAARGGGVVVTDGLRRASLSHIDPNLSGPKLAARFGESFREHRERQPEPPTVQAPRGRSVQPLAGASLEQRAQALVERLSATRATFAVADLRRAAFYQPQSVALVKEAMSTRHVVDLGKDARGAPRYACRDYLEAEARLFSAASALAGRGNLRLDASAVARTLAHQAPRLSDEQRAAVLHATSQGDLAQVVGHAGAGKTTAARAIAEAYREHGYEVRGAALAGKAAEGLQAEAGIPSRTLASLEHTWAEGNDRLHGGSVLVVDEAGMVEVRQLGRVLHHAQEQHAKVVLLEDPGQLKPIGAGDAYRGLLERHPSASVEIIRRQAEPWQRAASEHLAAGRVAATLDLYEHAGRLRGGARHPRLRAPRS